MDVVGQYLRQVRAGLDCPPAQQRELLAHLDEHLRDYTKGRQGVTGRELAEVFGAPARVAAEYQEGLDADVLACYRRTRARTTRLLLAVLVVSVLLFGGAAVWQGLKMQEFELAVVQVTYSEPGVSRATSSQSRVARYTYAGQEIAVVTLDVQFYYDGSCARVISASGSHTVADGWTYSGEELTAADGAATLTALVSNRYGAAAPVTVSLRCEPDGTIF